MVKKKVDNNIQAFDRIEAVPLYECSSTPCSVTSETNQLPMYQDTDENIPQNEADTNSPLGRSRSCTDVFCLLLFLLFLGSWIYVAYLGMKTGDLRKAFYPTDSHGHLCGQGHLSTRPYLLLYDLSQCLSPLALLSGCPTPHVCVANCPQENYSPLSSATLGLENQESIKTRVRQYCTIALTEKEVEEKSVQELVHEGHCPPWYISSTPVLGRCLPFMKEREQKDELVLKEDVRFERQVSKVNMTLAIHRLAGVFSLRELGEKVFSDLLDSWRLIVVALGGATILSLSWILLMRYLTAPMVLISIFAVLGGICALLVYCAHKLYIIWVSPDPSVLASILSISWTPYYLDDVMQLRDTWLAFTIILAIVLLILVLLFVILRQRIFLAISLIELASQAVSQALCSFIFPIIPLCMQLLICCWFLLVAAFLATSSEEEFRVAMQEGTNCSSHPSCYKTPSEQYMAADLCTRHSFSSCEAACSGATCQFVKYTRNKDYSFLQAFNVFGLYWGLFFCSSFSQLVLAVVFSHWYWSKDKRRLPSFPVCRAVCITVMFHLGTVAFGSLIIAIIRCIRVLLDWVEKRAKKWNNEVGKCILCCCKCCLWVLEKAMRFINRNAFIMCAVNSTNFCRSAKDAFNLLMRNIVRVVVLNSVSDFLLLIGKIVIVIGCGSVSYLALGGHIPHIRDELPVLNYNIIPTIFIIFISYLIASSFFSVYSMAVDTMFLCFVEDLERNDGSYERPYFMPRKLKKVLGKIEERDRLSYRDAKAFLVENRIFNVNGECECRI